MNTNLIKILESVRNVVDKKYHNVLETTLANMLKNVGIDRLRAESDEFIGLLKSIVNMIDRIYLDLVGDDEGKLNDVSPGVFAAELMKYRKDILDLAADATRNTLVETITVLPRETRQEKKDIVKILGVTERKQNKDLKPDAETLRKLTLAWTKTSDADYNGNDFIGSQEGEVLDLDAKNVIYVPPYFDVPAAPFEIQKTDAESMAIFIGVNVVKILELDVEPKVQVKEATVLAYHRFLAWRNGFVSPVWVPGDYYVNYNECVWATEQDLARGIKWVTENGDIDLYLPEGLRKMIRLTFSDRVALIAFVFRTRAHHWMPELDELYVRVWGKCRYKVEDMGASWKLISTMGLHAIFPIILDKHWERGCKLGEVNGALVKRFESAPAGAAGPFVVQQGIHDIEQIAPGIHKRLEGAYQYLSEVMPRLNENRYAGSVNHKYYGVARLQIDERKLGAAAAVVKAAVDGLASGDPLTRSAALNRIARYAPVTGAVLARAIGTIANRPEVVEPLLKE